jgi:tripartite ATP-independent transporter DctM subunit
MISSILILILIFLILLSLRVPIAFSIGIASLVTLMINMPADIAFTTIAQRIATGLDSFTLTAIPFFILAGELMNKGGIATRLINLAKSLVGRLPGGLGYVNIVACMLFGAVSGSAVAAASAIGGFMGKQMEKAGYEKSYGAAVNISSSVTGLIIPPSNVLIVYSLASGGASIAALFLAGYIPGILLGLSLMIVAGVYAHRKGYPTGKHIGIKESFKHFVNALPSLMLLILIIGGIVSGVFTATEASAVAVLYAFVLAFFVYKEIDLKGLYKVLVSAGKTTGIVMLLIGCSSAMSWVMSYESIPQQVSTLVLSLSDNKIVILLLINLILLLVGTFMDITPAVLIFTPIFLPVAQGLGISEIHFGIMMVLNLCIGLCTPPVGTVLFVGSSVAGLKISEVIKPLMPMFIVMLVVLLLVTFIPALSIWLPEIFGF